LDRKPLVYILISASLFGISSPLAKLLLRDISPIAMAGLLYLGAFLGLYFYSLMAPKKHSPAQAARLRKSDLPWLFGAILAGGVIAPISQMLGLNLSTGFSTSLLLNLEGVTTAVIAVFIFGENAGKRLWLAMLCMTLAGVLLSWNPGQSSFNPGGPLLILLAVTCWGIDNNLTRQLSGRNPIQITYLKGLIGGTTSLTVALVLGMKIPLDFMLIAALILGAFSYGISLVFFIKALRHMGSSRTGAFFSLGPFFGALVSLLILRESVGWVMIPAAILMAGGVWIISGERHEHPHVHLTTEHSHSHKHDDLHHLHPHPEKTSEPHAHEHVHEEFVHSHAHWPDTGHRHEH